MGSLIPITNGGNYGNGSNGSNGSNDSNGGNGNSNKNKPSLHYQLFMYQEELRHRKTRGISVTKAKISLTESLIHKNLQNLNKCTEEDLRIISREMSYQKHLETLMSRYFKLIELAMSGKKNVQKDSTPISTTMNSRVTSSN